MVLRQPLEAVVLWLAWCGGSMVNGPVFTTNFCFATCVLTREGEILTDYKRVKNGVSFCAPLGSTVKSQGLTYRNRIVRRK